MNIFECNISFYVNRIEIVFSVVNGKTFSYHVPEKIFKIGQAVQKLWSYFTLHVSITQ